MREAGSETTTTTTLPGWLRSALESNGKNPDEFEATLEATKRESASMGMGVQILLRDTRRGIPAAAKEAWPFHEAELTEAELQRARIAKRDFWPFFWFTSIFVNTVPWTPLVLPLILRVGESTKFFGKEAVVPPQLDRATDRRLDLLLRMKAGREDK